MPDYSHNDYFYMQHALALGEQARLIAPPNPWVGCVIVNQNGNIVGKGHTQAVGHAHAEICALNEAKEVAYGSTLYVTLEPCCHTGRTPPCTNALIKAGIKKVVIALKDTDSRVSGKGIEQLKQAGIEVLTGLCEEQARLSLKPYLFQRSNKRPYTILKAAVSLDGAIAAQDGSSQWISSIEARNHAHELRARSQALLISSQTALNDNPYLTVRHQTIQPINPPLRILLDSRGRVKPQGPLFDQTLAPTLVVSTDQASYEQKKEWNKAGVEVVYVKACANGLDLQEAWQLFGQKSLLQILVEGGGTLSSALLKQQLCQELSLYTGNCLLGNNGIPFFNEDVKTIADAPRFQLYSSQVLGTTVQTTYLIHS